jgi:hypothetical protein
MGHRAEWDRSPDREGRQGTFANRAERVGCRSSSGINRGLRIWTTTERGLAATLTDFERISSTCLSGARSSPDGFTQRPLCGGADERRGEQSAAAECGERDAG